jgi:hypothetical protein
MPAEQLVNLYQDFVASGGYTAGSGVLNVASGSGAPPSAPFTLTILQGNGGSPEVYNVILLLFRVTAVNSSTQFAGAAEGPDTNAAAGSLVIGSTLSVLAINNLFASSGGSFLQPLTAPNHSSLTDFNFNTGTGVVTNQYNNSSPVTSITLTQQDPNNTQEVVAIGKSKLASTFTLTIGFSVASLSTQGFAGLWLYDGSSNMIIAGYQADFGLRISLFTAFNNYSSDIVGPFQYAPYPAGPLLWFRVQETASARNYYVSSDGINFLQVFTESNTAHFTTSDYGFACDCRSGSTPEAISMTCYSLVETNP